jgi:hypothetical protein
MRIVSWLPILALACGLAGCGGGDVKKFPVAKTTGIVRCEGKPVVGAMVFFEPIQEGKSAVVGKQGHAFTGSDGRFSISTYGQEDGAVVGKHRVRVGGSVKGCPCMLNSEMDLKQVEIKEGQENTFELVLKKRTGPARKSREDDE